MTDCEHIFEVEFQEAGNPKGPEYRWFSEIGAAFAFMQGITSEAHIEEMTYRNHPIKTEPGAFASFLNHLTSRQAKSLDEDLPF